MSRGIGLLLAGLFVAGTLLCGAAALVVSWRTAGRVERLEPATAAGLRLSPPATEVLLEARLDDGNPILLPTFGFVAYLRERRPTWDDQGTAEAGDWSVVERATPPLLLALEGSPVRLANADYDLRDVETVEVGARAGRVAHTRYQGLKAGEAVLVVGSTLPAGEIPQVRAEFVARGTKDGFVAGQRSAGLIFAAASLVVALLGGLFLGRGLLGARRRGRS